MAGLIFPAAALAADPGGQVENYAEISWEDLIPAAFREDSQIDFDRYAVHDPAAGRDLAAYLEKRSQAPADPALNGRQIKIHGYIVPLERDADSALTEFLLVPYFGACIHVPPPPLNQIIHVLPQNPPKGLRAMDDVYVYGRLGVEAASLSANAAYSLEAIRIEAAGGPEAGSFLFALALTLGGGLSLGPGLVFAQTLGRKNPKLFGPILGFAAGIMTALGLSILAAGFSGATVLAFAAGGLTMALLEILMPHRPEPGPAGGRGRLAPLAIAVHNIPESFALFSAALASPALGLVLAGAMVSHNLPLGCSLVLSGPPGRQWPTLLAVGLAPALAAVSLYLLASPWLTPGNLSLLFAFVGGLMFYIAIRDIMPAAAKYGGRASAVRGCCAGFVFLIIMVSISRL